MKRLLLILLTIALAFTLAACGKLGVPTTPETGKEDDTVGEVELPDASDEEEASEDRIEEAEKSEDTTEEPEHPEGSEDMPEEPQDTPEKPGGEEEGDITEEPEDTKPVHNHSYTSKVTKTATCGATGTKTFICDCGNTYTESIPATGNHTYTAKVTKTATCGTVGTKTFTCACGNTPLFF